MSLPSLSKSNLKLIADHPAAALHPLRDINKKLHSNLYRGNIKPGEDVMQKDWDNLIIADCARVDLLKDVNDVPGELSSIRSKGSTSEEWLRKTFEGKTYNDTIYVTANANYDKLSGRVFFFVERIYRGNTVKDRRESMERLVEQTTDLHERYPNKRLITHLMMPHTPYLSEQAAKLREEIADRHNVTFRTDDYAGKTDPSDGLLQLASLLTAARFRLLSNEKLYEVYQNDLEEVIAKAEQLSENIDGKTVVTSDHGELMGERLAPLYLREWGHEANLNRAELRQVPWLVLESDERREIHADDPIDIEEIDEEVVEQSLEALGYK